MFLEASGCTLDAREKPAVCNYYACESALGGAPERNPHGGAPFVAYAAVRELWTRWTAEVAEVVRTAYPEGPEALDDALVTLLVTSYERLEREAGLSHLRPPPLHYDR